MDSFDVVTVGNATVDTFLQIHETNKHFRLDSQTGELCIKSGDKALVDKAYFMVGGNAANVSVGLSRLGFKSAILAEIGLDEFAEKIKKTLKREGVSELQLKQTPGASAFSVILSFRGERTIFQEDIEREHNFSFAQVSTKWVYLTSLGHKWEEAYRKTLEFVESKKAKLAFNPGTLQLDSGKEHLVSILRETEILFVSKEEAIKISGQEIMDKLLRALKNLGPQIVVITDGKNGSFIIDKNSNLLFHKASQYKVVEKTGAGDAYASGFLSAVLLGHNLKSAMSWGTENAGSVIGMVGAQSGLLIREEMERRVGQ